MTVFWAGSPPTGQVLLRLCSSGWSGCCNVKQRLGNAGSRLLPRWAPCDGRFWPGLPAVALRGSGWHLSAQSCAYELGAQLIHLADDDHRHLSVAAQEPAHALAVGWDIQKELEFTWRCFEAVFTPN